MSVVQISEFTKQVLKLIKSIPKGRVATYKQIAELAGKPQGSRGVGWILNSCSTKYELPWHRVLNSKGQISFDPQSSRFRKQRKGLLQEGIAVSPDGKLDLEKFRWKKRPAKKKRATRSPQMFK